MAQDRVDLSSLTDAERAEDEAAYWASHERNGNGRPVPNEPDASDREGVARPFVATDLVEMLRAGVPEPAMLTPWLYAKALVSLQSEPGIGKTFLVLWLAIQVMELGLHVVYMDEENGPEVIAERLQLLSADLDVLAERFHYYPFESRAWSATDLAAFKVDVLEAFDPALVILDSLADFLVEADKDEDKAKDVTKFIRSILGPVREQGGTLLTLDHLVKPQESHSGKKRGRYARGSGSKLGKVDASLLVDVTTPYDANTPGQIVLWKTKDRRGRLGLPDIRKGESGQLIDVEVGPGTVAFTPLAPSAAGPGWDGPTQCMDAIVHFLEVHRDEEMTGNQLAERLRAAGKSYRNQTIRDAAERLADDDRVRARPGPRKARLYQATDDLRLVDEPKEERF